MPRIKEVCLDGAKYFIAPLTIQQVRDLIASTPRLPGDDETKLFMGGPAFDGVYNTVCTGLNNAINEKAVDEGGVVLNGFRWTPELCIAKMDQKTIDVLQDEILKFSGLNFAKEGSKKTGEDSAASKT